MCALLRIPCPVGCISPQQEGDNGICRVTRVERREMEKHKREVCPMRLVCCEFCAKKVRACGVNAHLEECDEYIIVCPNGCNRMGKVTKLNRRELVHHLEEVCLYQKVECCNCCEEMERRYIEDHETNSCPKRKLKCEFCTQVVDALDIIKHLEVCDENFVQCSNGCLANKFKRKNLSEHLAENCPLERVNCPYSEFGCKERFKRKLVENHEKEFSHIHIKLTSQHFIKIQKEQSVDIESLKKDNQKLRAKLDVGSTRNVPYRGGIEWNINLIGRILENKERIHSDPFYVGLYKLQVSLDFSCSELVCLIYILSGQWDEDLTWPLRYKYRILFYTPEKGKFTLSHKISDDDLLKHSECFQRPTNIPGVGFVLPNFITYSQFLEGGFIYKDSVKLEIIVEKIDAKSRILNLFQSDIPGLRNSILKLDKQLASLKMGHLRWEIQSAKCKIEAAEFILSSHTFYAGFYKCRCQLEYNSRVSRYVACCIYCLKGKWDEALEWPIKGKLTIALINREDEAKNFSLVILRDDSNGNNFGTNPSTETSGYGIKEFCLKPDLLDEKYCLDDSIILDIEFEVYT